MVGDVEEDGLDPGEVGADEWVDAVDEEALDADAAMGDVALDAADCRSVGAGELEVFLGLVEHGELEVAGFCEADDSFGGFALSGADVVGGY